MFDIIVDGIVVDTVTAWDTNDAAVYASRKYGPTATVEPRAATADTPINRVTSMRPDGTVYHHQPR